MARVLSFLIRYYSKCYTLHRSDFAARAAPLDPRLFLNVERECHLMNMTPLTDILKRQPSIQRS